MLLWSIACDGPGDDSGKPAGDDSGTDSRPEVTDTGYALLYTEGTAYVTSDAWTGTEDYVSTSRNGGEEYCRVVADMTGTPSSEKCPDCTFAFLVTVGAGEATGDACDHVVMTSEMFEGESWIYAFAPLWAGDGGYTYENVLLVGWDSGSGIEWFPQAAAELYKSKEKTRIEYEALYADLLTYYEW